MSFGAIGGGDGGDGGTTLHTALTAPSRAANDQHPIGAITGLSARLPIVVQGAVLGAEILADIDPFLAFLPEGAIILIGFTDKSAAVYRFDGTSLVDENVITVHENVGILVCSMTAFTTAFEQVDGGGPILRMVAQFSEDPADLELAPLPLSPRQIEMVQALIDAGDLSALETAVGELSTAVDDLAPVHVILTENGTIPTNCNVVWVQEGDELVLPNNALYVVAVNSTSSTPVDVVNSTGYPLGTVSASTGKGLFAPTEGTGWFTLIAV